MSEILFNDLPSYISNNKEPNTFDELKEIKNFKSTTRNEYSFLSNFFPDVSNIDIYEFKLNVYLFEYKNIKFLSSEHFYQYYRYLMIDSEYSEIILLAKTSQEVKKLSGKGVYLEYKYEKLKGIKFTKISVKREYDSLKLNFNKESLKVMRAGLFLKFNSNEYLKNLLLQTKNFKLGEYGRFKKDFWCVTGENMLGRLLMELRDYFIENK